MRVSGRDVCWNRSEVCTESPIPVHVRLCCIKKVRVALCMWLNCVLSVLGCVWLSHTVILSSSVCGFSGQRKKHIVDNCYFHIIITGVCGCCRPITRNHIAWSSRVKRVTTIRVDRRSTMAYTIRKSSHRWVELSTKSTERQCNGVACLWCDCDPAAADRVIRIPIQPMRPRNKS